MSFGSFFTVALLFDLIPNNTSAVLFLASIFTVILAASKKDKSIDIFCLKILNVLFPILISGPFNSADPRFEKLGNDFSILVMYFLSSVLITDVGVGFDVGVGVGVACDEPPPPPEVTFPA